MDIEWLKTNVLLPMTNVWFAAFGVAVAWIITQARALSDLRKQGLENITLRVGLIEKLLVFDREQRDHLEKMDKLTAEIILNAANSDQVRKIRTELYNELTLEFIGSYYRYFKLAKWIEKPKELVREDLLPFLETCIHYVTYVNHEAILKATGEKPMLFHLSTFSFATSYIRAHTHFWNWSIQKRIRRCEAFFKRYESV